MIWNWLRKEEVKDEIRDCDFEQRILDLRRRIDEQRAWWAEHNTPQSFHVERYEKMVEQKQDMGKASETERRNKELEDIKAKLMGRKI